MLGIQALAHVFNIAIQQPLQIHRLVSMEDLAFSVFIQCNSARIMSRHQVSPLRALHTVTLTIVVVVVTNAKILLLKLNVAQNQIVSICRVQKSHQQLQFGIVLQLDRIDEFSN